MGNSPERRRNARTFTDTTTKRIQEIKNGLVLQVATKKGAFWKEICKIRARWDIHAPTQLPPANADLYLGRLLPSEAKLTEQDIYDLHSWERDIKRLGLWLAVPGLERYREEIEWWPFMAALVLYQPPLDALREFAKYGGIVPVTPEYGGEDSGTSHDPMLVNPLIHRLSHPYAVEWACRHYYETLMKEINEQFLKPRGMDIQELKAKLLQDGTFEQDLEEKLRKLPQDLYVHVHEGVTVDEVRKAGELAVSNHEGPEERQNVLAKASETKLMQVEIAHRYYSLREDYRAAVEHYQPKVGSAATYMRYARIGRTHLPEER
jgi:hypothetical protein